ncbi:ABC transporter permease [Georgenia sp. TF02-10]|uniref:ABC transporter permease n=1 Tax=Georgenia sp. TF02-10 TaxID=2917725 RepID=UPI001FA7535F|nr:ABC transporter permease [Georgenia sp. TF02-10]UNX54210.1 ABC transporter permease [Georgenia sp. TF02-10]
MTGLVAALVEAWEELRLHRLRVLLSLVGVAVSVAAMTGVMAVGQMTSQAQNEMLERDTGRRVTVMASAYAATDPDQVLPAMRALTERYQVSHSSVVLWASERFRADGGAAVDSQLQLVDQPYGTIHRLRVSEGSWFVPGDEQRRAPALVVNESFLRALGARDLAGAPTLTVRGERPTTMVITGVVPDRWEGEGPAAFALYDPYARTGGAAIDPAMGAVPQLELWVPPGAAEEAEQTVRDDLTTALGPDSQVDVYRTSLEDQEAFDATFQLVVLGIGTLLLLLGALSLVNIALVTVRQRIREIGIRRSFGATSARVFFSIMLESVVGTALAGLIGVAIAVAVVRALPMETWLGFAIEDVPPFPLGVAVTGLVAATAVGALAGLVPALVAVRVKPIDAIRY